MIKVNFYIFYLFSGVLFTSTAFAQEHTDIIKIKVGSNYISHEIAVCGEKFCDIGFANGKMYVLNVKIGDKMLDFVVKLGEDADLAKKVSKIIFIKNKKMIYLCGDNFVLDYKIIEDSNYINGAYLQPLKRLQSADTFAKMTILEVQPKDSKFVIFKWDGQLAVFYTFFNAPPPQFAKYDGSPFFTSSNATFEDVEKGIFVATTPTGIFSITSDESFFIIINDRLGDGPPLKSPIITKSIINEKEVVRIDDPSLPDQFMLYSPQTSGLTLNDKPK
jgi:hypothetical protein